MEITDLIIKTRTASSAPAKAGEIAEATNLEKNAVEKAMKVLKSEGRIVSCERCYWKAT